MEFFEPLFQLIVFILQALIFCGVFILVERLRPAEPNQPFKHIFFNLKWSVVYAFVAAAINAIGIGVLVELAQNMLSAPYFSLPAPNNLLEKIFSILFYLLMVDFFYYWLHRWQHKISFLWEEHKFHHSDVSLNVTSARRVHWLEDTLVLIFIFIPMGILFNIEPEELALIGFIDILWLHFTHMNLRLELGVFSSVIVGPQHHRVHHSFAPEHIDKNFAAFFPIWDILFGTYCPAKKGEFPPTGLTDKSTYNNLWEANILPFKEWSGTHYLGRFRRKFVQKSDRRRFR
jgi:sterol desaturase/sphingolipid hydroxylase (fatty acid hydroxylase superfamily)